LSNKSRLRITGLVKAMNVARQQLAAGIPPEEGADFRDWINDLIYQVEAICQKNKLRPSELPAPSYRAYLYLKGLDLKHLPPVRKGEKPAGSRIQVRGLVALVNTIQVRLSDLAQESAHKPKIAPSGKERLKDLLAEIHGAVEHTQTIFQDARSTPDDMPAPSLRAYRWLRFLSQEDHLQTHLAALRRAYAIARSFEKKATKEKKRKGRSLTIEFYNTRYLYRSKTQSGAATLTINEGFVQAPARVLKAILKSVLSGDPENYRQEIFRFTQSHEFSQISQALNTPTQKSSQQTRGRFFDLQRVFERVNATYFEGRMAKPQLTWNETITKRKLGHYEPDTDTVMVSITLDTSKTPQYVMDFIMYHELLHKQHGIKNVRGRRYAHTASFRKAESEFKQYQQAQDYLRKLGAWGKL
jgi:hypothetical protein